MEAYKRHYLTAKVATELFKMNPQYLSSMQRAKVDAQVEQLYRIQDAILHSPEVQWVNLSETEVDSALQTCIEGYESYSLFLAALDNQQLDEVALRKALSEELKCDKVLEMVSNSVPPLNQTDAKTYYEQHLHEFYRPQTWEMSQILITINDAYPENRRDQVLHRIWALYHQCDNGQFDTLALQHSECPSAMQNGYLGWCDAEKLYPQITERLALIAPNQVSTPIETELGFHLVKYQQTRPAGQATFEQAYPFLREKHEHRARQYLQRQWIAQLLSAYATFN